MTDKDAQTTQMGQDLVHQVASGDRRALARTITLIESQTKQDQALAEAFLAAAPRNANTIRLGISGAPGVGKSTLIEAFGAKLTAQGKRLAVLAVDPSSQRSGGSILGDKTRMPELSRNPQAFIRPSPAGQAFGGVTPHTRDTIRAVECAGFDVVIVETVGVGQTEVAVAGMVDMFLLLVAPAGGDDLQGIKRGIMELADLVVVSKADGDLKPAANRIAADVTNALHLMRPKWPGWTPPVVQVSAAQNMGLDLIDAAIGDFVTNQRTHDQWEKNRQAQALISLWSNFEQVVLQAIQNDPAIQAQRNVLEQDVAAGRMTANAAARILASHVLSGLKPPP